MNSEEFESLVNSTSRQKYIHISAVFPERSEELIAKLSEVLQDPSEALRTYAEFILMSVAADGVLAIEEFMLLRPLFVRINGSELEYDDAIQIFMARGFHELKNFRETLARMREIYSGLSPELQDEIVAVCLMVCAADGHITDDEKIWVKQLAVNDPDFDVDASIEEILSHRHSVKLNRRH